jgi:hypothetical protein
MNGSGGTADVLSVSGGSAGLQASYDAMRSLAADHVDVAFRLTRLSRVTARAATDPDLLESAVLSPGTAVRAEAAVVTATAGPDGVLLAATRCELDSLTIQAAVELFESADEARHDAFEVIDYLVGRALGAALLTPAGLVALEAVIALGGQDVVTDHPSQVEHLVNGGGGLLAGLTLGLLPTLTTQDGAEQVGDLYPDGQPVVTGLDVDLPTTQPTSVEDLIAHLGQLAELSTGADSPLNGTIEIQTVTGADGQTVHIVNLPGTDDLTTLPWTADDDVRDMGTNLGLIAGTTDDYQQGILEAMAQAGIGMDEPVLIVGHSQGGMEAVAILAADSGFTITDVVTAGSPTTQVGDLPPGSNVLSLEQYGDLVPLLDGEPNRPSLQQTTVLVDAHPASGIEAHHDYDVYVAAADAADHSSHPSVVSSIQSLHAHGFLGSGSHVTSQVFQITRAP